MFVMRVVIAAFLLTSLHSYGEGMDPLNRDEDISGTMVSEQVTRKGSGLYEYRYSLLFPESNKGDVLSFSIDVFCDRKFEKVRFVDNPDLDVMNYSEDGKHVPVQVYNSEQTFLTAITAKNMVSWGVLTGKPGSEANDMILISPAPPVSREYRLRPSMDTLGWDYPELEEHPEIPWIDDFVVTGLIDGPACDPGKPSPLYAGSKRGFETDDDNQLLTYRQPTRNRWHAEPGEEFLKLEILYSGSMDPKSFKVSPGWARQYFNPTPGAEETVSVPLRPGVNKIKLEARTEKERPPGGERPEFSRKDMDEFEVRLPAKGKGKSGK